MVSWLDRPCLRNARLRTPKGEGIVVDDCRPCDRPLRTPDNGLKRSWRLRLAGLALGLVAAYTLGLGAAHAAPAKTKKGKASEKVVAPAKDEPADPPPTAPAPPPAPTVAAAPIVAERRPVLLRAHSVNLSPQGIVYGDYSLNYQWMFAPGHALLGEMTVTWSGPEAERSRGVGAQVGYRYLSNGTQNSWLFGAMLGYDLGATVAAVTSTSTAEGSITRSYDLPYTRWRVTGNFGRRWVFGPGLNATVRVGIGPGSRAYARGASAEANHQAAVIENIVNLLPISLDSEVSLGWLF